MCKGCSEFCGKKYLYKKENHSKSDRLSRLNIPPDFEQTSLNHI